MKIISREDAKALGLKRFFTGKACANGHISERYVSINKCCTCGLIEYRAYADQNREYELKRKRQHMVRYYALHREQILAKNRKPPREISARAKAKAAGENRFFSGKPCPHGHLAERYVRGGGCMECHRIYQRRVKYTPQTKEVNRQRYLKYREKSLAHARKYYLKNAEELRRKQREYGVKNREKQTASKLKWRREHREEYRARKAKWRERNKPWIKAYNYKWNIEGPKYQPIGEAQWLKKNRAQLRSVKRYLKNQRHEQSESSHPEM